MTKNNPASRWLLLTPFFAGLSVFLSVSGPLFAAGAPSLSQFFPVAVQVATTNEVQAIGGFDPWPPKVWVDSADGIFFRPTTNSGVFSVEISGEARPGRRLVRFYNEHGASGLRSLFVTTEPQLRENEPNDDYLQPQLVSELPARLNGRLQKTGDVDSFALMLEAGQTLLAMVEARRLGAPLDAVVRLLDPEGQQLAWNHDHGKSLDPFLAFTAERSGKHVLQVFGFVYPPAYSVRLTGNERCVYRLLLSRGPYPKYALPMGVQRGVTNNIIVFGWNMGSSGNRNFTFDGSGLAPDTRWASFDGLGFDGAFRVPVGASPDRFEQEPNDSRADAGSLELPFAVTGRINKPGDEDRFSFSAKKGAQFFFEIQSISLGFPLESWLKLENSEGKVLAENEENPLLDPVLEWTAPEDGTFSVAVGGLLNRGGPDYVYRLTGCQPEPDLLATVGANTFTLESGKTNKIKVELERFHGLRADVSVLADGLPSGVTAEMVRVTRDTNEVSLELVAAPGAEVYSGPFHLLVRWGDPSIERRVVNELISPRRKPKKSTKFTRSLLDPTDHLWLTVKPPPPPKKEEEKKQE